MSVIDFAPSDDELREQYPEVEAFAALMREQLWHNRHKGDQQSWQNMTLRESWGEIAWHEGKLAGALKLEDEPLMRELAVDVGNMAMIFLDILNVGEVPR